MGESILTALGSIPNELKLLIVSMIPIIELRGAIPLGVAVLNMGIWETFLISFIGNILPVPFLILLTRPIFTWLKKTKFLAPLVNKLEKRIEKKAADVMKHAALGLFFFVAIPLPGTGAWTGSMIASMLDMRFKYALPSIIIGVAVAGVIMTIGSYGLTSLIGLFIS